MPRTMAVLRVARRIHAIYEKRAAQALTHQNLRFQDLERRYRDVRRLHQLVDVARTRGWHAAAGDTQRRLRLDVQGLQSALKQMQDDLAQPSGLIPSLRDILAELRSLDSEFDTVAIDKKFIAVDTAPIVLEEIRLGRFSVRLHWSRLADRANVTCFDVVALEPNPASEHDDVPHPHVRDRELCAGEASLPLQRALEQGRLGDAFCLMRSVLETYNPDSPHVSLANWGGHSCWHCGCPTTEDESYFCEGCDHDICNECMSSCKHCDHTRCSSCIGRCDVCNEACCRRCLAKSACSDLSLCKDCLRTCDVCGDKVAPEEFDADTRTCPTCTDVASDDEASDNTQAISPTSS